jgi:hypothetical protein
MGVMNIGARQGPVFVWRGEGQGRRCSGPRPDLCADTKESQSDGKEESSNDGRQWI